MRCQPGVSVADSPQRDPSGNVVHAAAREQTMMAAARRDRVEPARQAARAPGDVIMRQRSVLSARRLFVLGSVALRGSLAPLLLPRLLALFRRQLLPALL